MNELFERWEAKTPDFWVKVKKIAIGLGSTALSIWLINISLGLNLAPWILEGCKYTLTAAVACGFSAKLTKE